MCIVDKLAKEKEDELEAAKVFDSFVASFADEDSNSKTFVRSSSSKYNKSSEVGGELYKLGMDSL